MQTCRADPVTACCSADCRHALRSESRPGLWEHGNSESPDEEDEQVRSAGSPEGPENSQRIQDANLFCNFRSSISHPTLILSIMVVSGHQYWLNWTMSGAAL